MFSQEICRRNTELTPTLNIYVQIWGTRAMVEEISKISPCKKCNPTIDLTAQIDPSQEQIAFVMANPHKQLRDCLSSVDLWEIGGEFLAIRRKEALKVAKQKDEIDRDEMKRQLIRIEATAESKWKRRLLALFELLGYFESGYWVKKTGRKELTGYDIFVYDNTSTRHCHKTW